MALLRRRFRGMTMFELIAAMVLVAILTPTMSYIISNTMRSIAATRIGLDADEDAEYVKVSSSISVADKVMILAVSSLVV